MFIRPQRGDFPVLATYGTLVEFHGADVLFALEWSAVAPGVGGWDVLIDDERHTRLISVVPPGSNEPAFVALRKDSAVVVIWLSANSKGEAMELGRFSSLRTAMLALCPLDPDVLQHVNESMEALHPRTLRDG